MLNKPAYLLMEGLFSFSIVATVLIIFIPHFSQIYQSSKNDDQTIAEMHSDFEQRIMDIDIESVDLIWEIDLALH